MESTQPSPSSAAATLSQAEQAAAGAMLAPPPPIPAWAWLAYAVCGSAFALGFALDGALAASLPAVAASAAFFLSVHLVREQGIVADPRSQPRQLTRSQVAMVVQILLLAAAMIALGLTVNRWVPVALTGPLFALLGWLHERQMAATAAALRADHR